MLSLFSLSKIRRNALQTLHFCAIIGVVMQNRKVRCIGYGNPKYDHCTGTKACARAGRAGMVRSTHFGRAGAGAGLLVLFPHHSGGRQLHGAHAGQWGQADRLGRGLHAPARGRGDRGQLYFLRQTAGQAGHRQRRRHHLHRLRCRNCGSKRGAAAGGLHCSPHPSGL